MLERASMNSRPRFMSANIIGIGRGVQIESAINSASVGVRINSVGDAEEGRTGSLMNSFTPSAIGCRSPKGPTMLGPFRSCM